jgi:hypothetical protein
MLTAIETTGTINTNHQIVLDKELPISEKSRVRVIVLFDENSVDINEKDWLKSASRNDAFNFLNDDAEDIYTLADGKPLQNEK